MLCKPINFRLLIFLIFALLLINLVNTKAATPPKIYPSFRVEVKGKGQPLLLIPGLGCSGKVWDETVTRYSSRYECHIFTLAGYAGVPPVQEPLLQSASRDIRQYVRDLRLQQPVVMGHSIGGYLSLKMATEEPKLFSKVLVVDALPFLAGAANAGATEESVRAQDWEGVTRNTVALPQEQFAQYQRQSVKSMVSDPARVEQVLAWGLQSDRATMMQSAAEMMQNDLRQELAAITAPVLVLGSFYLGPKQQAEQEQQPGLITYQEQYAQLKGVQIVMNNHARHFLMYDDPNWFFKQTDSFLK